MCNCQVIFFYKVVLIVFTLQTSCVCMLPLGISLMALRIIAKPLPSYLSVSVRDLKSTIYNVQLDLHFDSLMVTLPVTSIVKTRFPSDALFIY